MTVRITSHWRSEALRQNPAFQEARIDLDRFAARTAEIEAERSTPAPAIRPASTADRTANELRPDRLRDVVGQDAAKKLIEKALHRAAQTGKLDHILLLGPSGTGKSTLAHIIGNERGVQVFQSSAPVSYDVLLELREQMNDGDVLFVDEIHLQAIAERRGRESISSPEQFYSILEDRVILTPQGPLPFPAVTVIGATTDPGRLPEPFLKRFPLRPRMVPYTDADLALIATRNARSLSMRVTAKGAIAVARAAAGQPRIVNNLVRNAQLFGPRLDTRTVTEVREANGISEDGLDAMQQEMLRWLYTRGARTTSRGVIYQSSIGSLATALGLSRDVKAVQLYVEPLLIQRGYVQTSQQGRHLTDLGIQRAIQIGGTP